MNQEMQKYAAMTITEDTPSNEAMKIVLAKAERVQQAAKDFVHEAETWEGYQTLKRQFLLPYL